MKEKDKVKTPVKLETVESSSNESSSKSLEISVNSDDSKKFEDNDVGWEDIERKY